MKKFLTLYFLLVAFSLACIYYFSPNNKFNVGDCFVRKDAEEWEKIPAKVLKVGKAKYLYEVEGKQLTSYFKDIDDNNTWSKCE